MQILCSTEVHVEPSKQASEQVNECNGKVEILQIFMGHSKGGWNSDHFC